MQKQTIQDALEGGWRPGYSIFLMLRSSVYFYVGDENEHILTFKEIAGESEFWKALGKTRGWSDVVTENKFSDYIKLDFHNMDTGAYLQNL